MPGALGVGSTIEGLVLKQVTRDLGLRKTEKESGGAALSAEESSHLKVGKHFRRTKG